MLSTPPAFILSQDQTLMFKFVIADVRFSVSEKSTVLKEPIFWLVVRQIFKICLNKFIRIFQGFSLFNFQCSSLTCCCLCYQRQLIYNIKLSSVCQQLFLFFYFPKSSIYFRKQICTARSSPNQCGSRVSFCIIPPYTMKVNNFFYFFIYFFSFHNIWDIRSCI